MSRENQRARILPPEDLWRAYLKEKQQLPTAVESWLRPLLIGVYDARMLLENPQATYEMIVSLLGDFPSAFWSREREGTELDAPYFWGDVLEYAKQHTAHDPIERLLCYPEASPSLLLWAWSAGYKEAVLRHPTCTRAMVESFPGDNSGGLPYREELHTHQLDYLKLHTASNPSSTSAQLEAILSSSPERELLAGIAQNPSADTRVLSLLWDRSPEHHRLIAIHPRTAPFILREFSQGKLMCQYITQNISLPAGLAVPLCEQFIAQLHRAKTTEIQREPQQAINRLGLNFGLAPETLAQLAAIIIKEENQGGAISLLLNPATPLASKQALREVGVYPGRVYDSKKALSADDGSHQKEYQWLCQQSLFPQVWGLPL